MLLLLFNQSSSASQTLTPSLFVNVNVFYSPTITGGALAQPPTPGGGVGIFAGGPYTGPFRKKKRKKTEELPDPIRALEAPKTKPPVIYDRPLISAFFDRDNTVKEIMSRAKASAASKQQEEDDELAASLLLL